MLTRISFLNIVDCGSVKLNEMRKMLVSENTAANLEVCISQGCLFSVLLYMNLERSVIV